MLLAIENRGILAFSFLKCLGWRGLDFKISLFGEPTKSRGSIHFLKALFKTLSEINKGLWLCGYLKYSRSKITNSRHMRQNYFSFKMNVFFILRQKRLKISVHDFQSCRIQLCRQILDVKVHKMSSVEHKT